MEVVDEVADLFAQEKPAVCADRDTLAHARQGRLDAAGKAQVCTVCSVPSLCARSWHTRRGKMGRKA
jgi:hypothetical protein